MSRRILMRVAALLGVALVTWIGRSARSTSPPAPVPGVATPAPAAPPAAGHSEIGFLDPSRLAEHFQQHGAFLAFDCDLVIRTGFRPNDGAAYFQRPLRRGHRGP